MRKVSIALLVFASLMLFTACTESGDVTGPASAEYIGGTTGLLIDFLEDSPPASILDNSQQTFTITVQLENGGEVDIPKDKCWVSITGINPEDFYSSIGELTDINPDENIEGNKLNPDTGQTIPSYPVYVEFTDLKYVDSLSGGGHNFPVYADVCYEYATEASAELCIKKDLTDSLDDHVCQVSGPKDFETSGAPVQITTFEEYPSGKNAIAFTFTVKHMANGKISQLGTRCSDSVTDENKVKVTVDTDIEGDLTCSGLTDLDATTGSGYIKLSGGERTVRCTQKLPLEDKRTDHIKIIKLTLDYDYFDHKETTLRVQHSELDE
ncbi:MAG: hypothetical protein ABIE94_06680 [archaeon]